MKKYFKKLAARIVTFYAKRTFDEGIRLAESWRKVTGKRHYLISDPNDERKLVAIDARGHCLIRKQFGGTGKAMPIKDLKKQCWYYTVNERGLDQINPRDLMIRKYAFIQDRLAAAGLLNKEELLKKYEK